jgi:hypothetical protein
MMNLNGLPEDPFLMGTLMDTRPPRHGAAARREASA